MKKKRGESLELKQFMCMMLNFERVTNWMSRETRHSNLMPNFQRNLEKWHPIGRPLYI
jgi:hypothetical protein